MAFIWDKKRLPVSKSLITLFIRRYPLSRFALHPTELSYKTQQKLHQNKYLIYRAGQYSVCGVITFYYLFKVQKDLLFIPEILIISHLFYVISLCN